MKDILFKEGEKMNKCVLLSIITIAIITTIIIKMVML